MTPPPPPPPTPREDAGDAPEGGLRLAPGVDLPLWAVKFTATRSSGPGGQNVNKRSTKVELRTHIEAIAISDAARQRLAKLLGERLTEDGEVLIVCDEHRSQRQNRDTAVERLGELVRVALVAPKRRIATKPSKGAKQRRLTEKKQRGETKARRKRPKGEE